METVEVVVKIPKFVYDMTKAQKKVIDADVEIVGKAIANGTVLPKNHGRLIDSEQLMNYCQNQIDGHKYADCNVIARFPIVLNAEVENENNSGET